MKSHRIQVLSLVSVLIVSNVIWYLIYHQETEKIQRLATRQAHRVAEHVIEANQDLASVSDPKDAASEDAVLRTVLKLQTAYAAVQVLKEDGIELVSGHPAGIDNRVSLIESGLIYMMTHKDYAQFGRLKQQLAAVASKLPVDATPDYMKRFRRAVSEIESGK